MQALPIRLSPGDDLRQALGLTLALHRAEAAYIVQGIGSLSAVELRFAGVDQPASLRGDYEILTLAGSLSVDGAHLHMSVADAQGRVLGGHVAPGCIVRTTAEVLLMLLPAYRFTREHDAQTGFAELVIRQDPHA
jgi:predicted DNA-binding protein with PD1-like motif